MMRRSIGMIAGLLRGSEFNRSVLTLMKGTLIAQVIPIAISPILTRMYTPQDFGIFALYMALGSILLVVGTGRYELAIILPEEDAEAKDVVALVALTSVCLAVGVLAVVIFCSARIADLLNNEDIRYWLFLLPVSVIASGIQTALYYYNNRNGQYGNMAGAKVCQSVTAGGMNVAFGAMNVAKGGLILGAVIGQLAAMTYLIGRTARHFAGMKMRPDALWSSMRKYRKFPALQLPSTLIEALSTQAPILLLSSFFGPAMLGLYSLSERVARIPITMVSASVGDVFRQNAGRSFTTRGNARRIFIETLAKLLLVATPSFLAFFFVAPWLFSFVFGEAWRIAGEYAQILTPMFWMSFIVAPLSNMFMIAQKQEYDLALQIGLICASVAALLGGYYTFGTAEHALALLAAVYCLKYSIELVLAYRFASNRGAQG